MKIAEKILNMLEQVVAYVAEDPLAKIRDAFQRLVNKYFSDISVVDVERDMDLIAVTFQDNDDQEELTAIFGADEDGVYCYIVDDEGDEGEGGVEIDLDPLDPPTYQDPTGFTMPDLTQVDEWMNKSTIIAILTAGGADPEAIPGAEPAVGEAFKWVVRGGRKVKIPIIRRHHKPLSPARRRALVMARRKSHTSQAMRHRRLSMKIRNRLHL